MVIKAAITIVLEDREKTTQRVCWYEGTSDSMIVDAVRMLFKLSPLAQFLLRDSDGDIVPFSSTLPRNQTYHLIVFDANDETLSNGIKHPGQEMMPSKKRKLSSTESSRDDEESISTSPVTDAYVQNPLYLAAPATPPSSTFSSSRPRSLANTIKKFIEIFTRPIEHDDYISFIPSIGEYSLYTLYCLLFPDPLYHAHGQNAFYKMTSRHGKIDRQRVIRYYRSTKEGENIKYVELKPEGKGVLLRQYVPINELSLIENASFIKDYNLNSDEAIQRYIIFVRGFEPISKLMYRTAIREQSSKDTDGEILGVVATSTLNNVF